MFPPFRSLLLALVCAFGLAADTAPAWAREPGRLLVHLETDPAAPPPTVVTLDGVTASFADGTEAPVELRLRELRAAELAGTQVLLGIATAPPGRCTGLVVRLATVATRLGTAPVFPAVDPAGHRLDVDVSLDARGCASLLLRWRPALDSVADQPYRPALGVLDAPLPPLGALAVASDPALDALVAIDRDSGRVVAVRSVGREPRGMAYARAQQKLYVALAGEDALVELDAQTLRPLRRVSLRFGDGPVRLALAPDETRLHVLCPGSRSLVVLDAWSLQEQGRIAVGEGARDLAVDASDGWVYVACEEEGQVQVVDPVRGRLAGAYAGVPAPVSVALDDRSRTLHVGSGVQHRIHAIDLAGGGVAATLAVCGRARHLAVHEPAGQVYAALPDCGQVVVARPATGLEFAPLQLPDAVSRLVFAGDFRRLLAASPAAGAVLVVDVQRGTLIARAETGGRPDAVVAP